MTKHLKKSYFTYNFFLKIFVLLNIFVSLEEEKTTTMQLEEIRKIDERELLLDSVRDFNERSLFPSKTFED